MNKKYKIGDKVKYTGPTGTLNTGTVYTVWYSGKYDFALQENDTFVYQYHDKHFELVEEGTIPGIIQYTNEEKLIDDQISMLQKLVAKKNDPVNHPSHYTFGTIETITFIEDKKLDFHLANVVKYCTRAGKKDPNKEVEDLEKALFYLKRKIELLKGTKC